MFCHLVTGWFFSQPRPGSAAWNVPHCDTQKVQRATATWSRHAVRLPTQVRPTGGKGQKNLVINGGTDHWNKLGYCMFCEFLSFILSTFFDHSKTTCLSRSRIQHRCVLKILFSSVSRVPPIPMDLFTSVSHIFSPCKWPLAAVNENHQVFICCSWPPLTDELNHGGCGPCGPCGRGDTERLWTWLISGIFMELIGQ